VPRLEGRRCVHYGWRFLSVDLLIENFIKQGASSTLDCPVATIMPAKRSTFV